jgi:hypothetical protein
MKRHSIVFLISILLVFFIKVMNMSTNPISFMELDL